MVLKKNISENLTIEPAGAQSYRSFCQMVADMDTFVRRFDPSGLEPFTLNIGRFRNDHRVVEYGWDENKHAY
jgi:hypothetical protein